MDRLAYETVVVEVKEAKNGYWHALEATPFYAEGGGQPADRGTIDTQDVLDVQTMDGDVWHLLREPIATRSRVTARVDEAVRRDHSIQHTAQHVITAVLEDRHGIETLSFGISAEDASIEIGTDEMSWSQVERLEAELLQIIFENRPVRMMELSEAQVERTRLRKATDRTGTIRIVEIDGLDYNACGGTHVDTTGQLGMIVVTGVKKVRGNVRLTYVAGERALFASQREREALRTIHRTLSTTNETVADRVVEERAIRLEREKEIKELERNIADAKVEAVRNEEEYVAIHIGKAEAETLTLTIIERIASMGKIAVGANHAEQKLFVMHDGTHDIAVGKFMKTALGELGFGRGGGSHKQAQARFASDAELERALEDIVRRLQEGVLPC